MKRLLILPLVMLLFGYTTSICSASPVETEQGPLAQANSHKKSYGDKKGPEWINGTWHLRTTIHNDFLGDIKTDTYVYINRKTNRIKVVDSGDVLYNGTYVVEGNSIKYDRHANYCSSLDLNLKTKRIDFGDGNYMVKVSDSPGI